MCVAPFSSDLSLAEGLLVVDKFVFVPQAHGTGTSLGDPIELGAATSVLKAASPELPVVLQASKSSVSHSEAAAGLMGMVFAMLPTCKAATASLTHLKHLNEHVAVAMGADNDGSVWSAPRGNGSLGAGAKRVVAGTSSFAYMGTNAHAVTGAGVSEKGAVCCEAMTWQRRRHYAVVPGHYILSSMVKARSGIDGGEVVLEGPVASQQVAYMWDHKVH